MPAHLGYQLRKIKIVTNRRANNPCLRRDTRNDAVPGKRRFHAHDRHIFKIFIQQAAVWSKCEQLVFDKWASRINFIGVEYGCRKTERDVIFPGKISSQLTIALFVFFHCHDCSLGPKYQPGPVLTHRS